MKREWLMLTVVVGTAILSAPNFNDLKGTVGGEAFPLCDSSGLDATNDCPDMNGFVCNTKYTTCIQDHGNATNLCHDHNRVPAPSGCAGNVLKCGTTIDKRHGGTCEPQDLGD